MTSARSFSRRSCTSPRSGWLLSDEHFGVDGTLIEAWKRDSVTWVIARPGRERGPNPALPGQSDRDGLIVDTLVTPASGTAEREAARAMIGRHRAVLAADKGYDAADFVAELRALEVTPHVAQNTSRRSAIDGRTTRHPGYAASQRLRKRIEEAFGWITTTGGLRKTRHRGTARVGWLLTLTAAAYNLVQLPKLLAAA